MTGTVLLALVLSAAVGYLLGSINWGIILTRLFHQGDIRTYGSGNAGMTNVLRSVGKLPALLTFIGDFVKCVAAVLLAGLFIHLLGPRDAAIYPELWKYAQLAAGTACVLGHIYPVFFGFRGGKGIVTAAAMIALLDWRVFLLILATFGLVFLLSKFIISLASVVCAALYPVYTFLIAFFFDFAGSPLSGNAGRSLPYLVCVTLAALFIGGLVLIKHRANIGRLLRGEEKPIVPKKK